MIGNENDLPQWLRFHIWMREKHHLAGGFSDKAARDIAKKWVQHDFLFERAGNNHVDLVAVEHAENGLGWIAVFVMNWGIGRKLHLRERIVERLRCLLITIAHINQMKVGRKSVPDSLRFSKYLLESRRKSRGDGNCAVRRWDGHVAIINLDFLRISATAGKTSPSYKSAFHFEFLCEFRL